jgi:ankyrin repeat protein
MNKPSSIDDYDVNGMTPLLYAVFKGDLDSVQNLLNEGANPSKPQRDDATATPLWHAEQDFGLTEIGKLLRAYGAK